MSWQDIPGWSGFLWIYDRMVDEAVDGDTIVEIGVAFGRSIAYLARRVIDSGKDIRIVAIDPWRDDWWMPPNDYPTDAPRPTWGGEHADWARAQGGPFRSFVKSMMTHAPEELERIDVLRAYATDARWQFNLNSLRGLMIDGNHNYQQVRSDIEDWRSRVKPGGILAGDDYHMTDFPGVVRAVREAFPSGYNTQGTTWWIDV